MGMAMGIDIELPGWRWYQSFPTYLVPLKSLFVPKELWNQ
ncbi:hypothetical protein Tco_1100820, partial [Tanacetum coccineum]